MKKKLITNQLFILFTYFNQYTNKKSRKMTTTMTNTKSGYAWISLDPVRKQIDIYPRVIAEKIESQYLLYIKDPSNTKHIPFGADFFNATLHLCDSGFYQTTPSVHYGRSGFKAPGYRCVDRVFVEDNRFTVYGKRIHGEWRLHNDADYNDWTFVENISSNNIFLSNKSNILNNSSKIEPWDPKDLLENNNEKFVVAWMWCRGTEENEGDIFKLSDKWWAPYFDEVNKDIESAFNTNNNNITIILYDHTLRTINFKFNSCYAKQIRKPTYSNNLYGIRMMKRVIITIGELKEKIKEFNTITIDPSILQTLVEQDKIPHEFYCSISQDIMRDPVKTEDNHTYDRSSIERWFQHRISSPLTGLELNSSQLTPNDELRKCIQEFTKLQIEKKQKSTNQVLSSI